MLNISKIGTNEGACLVLFIAPSAALPMLLPTPTMVMREKRRTQSRRRHCCCCCRLIGASFSYPWSQHCSFHHLLPVASLSLGVIWCCGSQWRQAMEQYSSSSPDSSTIVAASTATEAAAAARQIDKLFKCQAEWNVVEFITKCKSYANTVSSHAA